MSDYVSSSYTISAAERQRLAEEERRRAEEERRRRQEEEERRRREEEAARRRRVLALIEISQRLEAMGCSTQAAPAGSGPAAGDAASRTRNRVADVDANAPLESMLTEIKDVLAKVPGELIAVVEPELSAIRSAAADIEKHRGRDFSMQRERLFHQRRALRALLASAPARLEAVAKAQREADLLAAELAGTTPQAPGGGVDVALLAQVRQLQAEVAERRGQPASMALVKELPRLQARAAALREACLVARCAAREREFVADAVRGTLVDMGYRPCDLPGDGDAAERGRVLAFRAPHGQAVRLTLGQDASLEAEFVVDPAAEPAPDGLTAGDLVGQCGNWCRDFDELVARSARRGVEIQVRGRIPPDRGSFLAQFAWEGQDAAPAADEERPTSRRRAGSPKRAGKPKERHVE